MNEYRLKDMFVANKGKWISLPDILRLHIAQYNRAIHGYRRSGMKIINQIECRDGKKKSWYKFLGMKGR